MQDYFKNVEIFTPVKKEKYIEITVPVITDMNHDFLELRIIPTESGYTICNNGKAFSDFNEPTKYYYDLFMEKDPNYHYEIKLDGNIIYKKYSEDFSTRVAINEFVKFFVYLDDFILKNELD